MLIASREFWKRSPLLHVVRTGLAFSLFVATLAQADPLAVRLGDFELVLTEKSERLQVFDYTGRQTVFIFDFPTLAEQGRTFNRIVALIERIGLARARVLGDAELAAFIRSTGKTESTFASGNDFLVSELVIFFNLAEHGGITLNEEELRLRTFLFEQGLMRERFGFLQAIRPNVVILSIPQEKQGAGESSVNSLARRTILAHELAHAEYYTNLEYRAWCHKFWFEVLSERQRGNLRAFLARSGYDPENQELMINETQAYLSFTPDPRAFNARMVKLADTELDGLRQAFRTGAPAWPMTRR